MRPSPPSLSLTLVPPCPAAACFTFRSVTVFDGDVDFRTAFDTAGRRIDQLSDANQVLCAAYLAIGARCTDHPGLLGPNAPRLSDLRDTTRSADRDLSPYGQARAEVCKELTVKALALADEKGLFRKASPEGVAALLLIENLLPRASFPSPFSTVRELTFFRSTSRRLRLCRHLLLAHLQPPGSRAPYTGSERPRGSAESAGNGPLVDGLRALPSLTRFHCVPAEQERSADSRCPHVRFPRPECDLLRGRAVAPS